jgi:hypothetical protein
MLELVALTKMEMQHSIHPKQILKTFLSIMMHSIDKQVNQNIFLEGQDVHHLIYRLNTTLW